MATDKRLDQVSNLTDFDYALIVKGEQVSKISKADLASVVAELIGFNQSRLVESRSVKSSDNIDNLKAVCGNYMYWGGSVPQGSFPITMTSSISFLLFCRFVGGMGFQTLYTGLVGMGSLTHKYERVFTDKWGAWKDLGAVNSPN